MNHFGLIGYPLSHSFSKGYFTEKFIKEGIQNANYDTYPIEKIEDFQSLCKENNFAGLNVTIPYKQSIMAFLDEINKEAANIGAVNTIKFLNGKKIGYNSDIYGFEMSLKPLLKSHHKNALILGTGGASKAVEYTLKKLDINYIYISRKRENNILSYEDLNEEIINTHHLIINTTPLGMFPNTQDAPNIPYQFLNQQHLLYDLVYNPTETLFLLNGKNKNAQIKNGLEMLYLQAERSWQIWNER
jgi:shikimate dehydrogenase